MTWQAPKPSTYPVGQRHLDPEWRPHRYTDPAELAPTAEELHAWWAARGYDGPPDLGGEK
jgi:hypothetical protein